MSIDATVNDLPKEVKFDGEKTREWLWDLAKA